MIEEDRSEEKLRKTEGSEEYQRLRESEEKYRSLFKSMLLGVVYQDNNGLIISANPAAEEILGLSIDQMQGRTSTDPRWKSINENGSDFPGESHPAMIALKTGEKVENVIMGVFDPKTEQTRWININATPQYKNGEIKPFQVYTTFEDITERVEREKLSDALNKVNANLNSSLDYNTIMNSIVEDGAKAIGAESSLINLVVNGNWVVEFVYNFPSNIVGQIKSDQESPTSVYVAKKKEAVAFNDAINDPRVNVDGMKMHGVASLLAAPIILKDNVKGIIAFYHHKKSVIFTRAQIDFTNKLAASLSQAIENAELFDDIKKSEVKYHSLYSSMNEGVALHKILYNSNHEPIDYVIIDINPSYEKITGIKENDVIGKKASEIYGTGKPPYLKIYANVAEKGESTEFETYFKPMKTYFKISVISPEKGKFATIFEDITKRKKTEKQKQELLENEQQFTEELQVINEELVQKGNELIAVNNAKQESEERLHLAQIRGNVGVWDWNTVTNELKFTPELEQLYGLRPGTINTYQDWRQLTHPDDIIKIEAERDANIANHEQFDLEFRIFHDSGDIRWLSAKGGAIYNNEGNVIRVLGVNTDITERKKAEIEVMRSNQRISEIIESIQDNFYVLDYDWNYVHINNQSAAIIGLEPQDFIGQNHWKMFPQYKGTVLEDNFREAMEKREVRRFEIYSPYNDNWFIVTVYPSAEGITVLGTNITERKKVEEALYQSQKLLQDVINGFPSPIFVKDVEGRFLTINSKLEEQLGVKSEELKGKTDYDISTKELAEYYRLNDQKVLEEGKAILIEEEADLVDGHHTLLNHKFPIYDINGKPYGVGSISTDITERKLLEEKLVFQSNLLSRVQDAIIALDGNYNVSYWNKMAEEMFGWSEDEVIGRNSGELLQSKIPNSSRDKSIEKMENESKYDGEVYYRHKDGHYIPTYIRATTLTDEKGNITGVLSSMRDITEIKNREEKEQKFIEELTRSNVELERFAYVSSHDLQEPLRMVTLYSQLLERRYKDRLDSDSDDFIEYIVEGAQRMRLLIDGLLEYSRVNSQTTIFKKVDLETVLDAVIHNLKIIIDENNVSISHNNLPTILGDQNQMLQVFQNLISNAIKFHGSQPPKINISVKKNEKEWIIAVKDNGIGIDPKYQKQIFEVFKRLHTKQQYPGTGIGLSITQKIILQHGGQIWVESELGKGTTFYFTIPNKT